jgi:hypothetical protein
MLLGDPHGKACRHALNREYEAGRDKPMDALNRVRSFVDVVRESG